MSKFEDGEEVKQGTVLSTFADGKERKCVVRYYDCTLKIYNEDKLTRIIDKTTRCVKSGNRCPACNSPGRWTREEYGYGGDDKYCSTCKRNWKPGLTYLVYDGKLNIAVNRGDNVKLPNGETIKVDV